MKDVTKYIFVKVFHLTFSKRKEIIVMVFRQSNDSNTCFQFENKTSNYFSQK